MILGYTLLWLALALTVAANVLFTLARRRGWEEKFLTLARGTVVGSAAAVVGAAGYLAYLIATHQFQVAYVAEYSAKRSAAAYLFAAFWGGQEGSILLWAFWTAVIGVVLAFKAGGRASRVWPIYGIAQIFLLSLLLIKCPFAVGTGPVPTDGRGLNPLLENMWMVIHPPILFLGFSALLVPFAWCVYGLAYKDWDGWAKAAFPWTLFAFTTLGLGLSLGGYWAYETLGWGGFWGWDPVENSSLVPWLFMTALLHGLLLQNKNGGYKVTNFVLGFLPFAWMFWGTFLTRTGLLSDFSVHSFSSLGESGYKLMLGAVIASFGIPLGMLLWRVRSIPKPDAYENVWTREFGFFLASSVLGVIGTIVAVGMSAPLITKIKPLANALHVDPVKGAAANPEFYNQGNYPLVILLAVGMAVTPYLAWKAKNGDENKDVLRRLTPAYWAAVLIAVGFTAAGIFFGHLENRPWMVLLFATSVFTVIANAMLIAPRLRTRQARKTVGGFVAHAGVGLTLMGVASLVLFSQRAERVTLVKDVPEYKLGYKLTYRGMTTQPFDRKYNALRVEVEKDGRVWEARPRYYVAPWENKDTIFANPPAILPSVYNLNTIGDVANLLPWKNPFPLGDLYIAYNGGPQSLDGEEKPNSNNGFVLKERESKEFGDYTFSLLGLTLDETARATLAKRDPKAMAALPEVFFKAFVGVTYQGKMQIVEPQFKLEQKTGGLYSLPVRIPGPEGVQVMLQFQAPPPMAMQSADPFRLGLLFKTLNAPDPTEAVMVDVSTKPMIGLVWLGTLLYTLGGFVAYRRRAAETGLLGDLGADDGDSNRAGHPGKTATRKPVKTSRG
jgi:cytochrome c-type biogenesis protein CcmF